MPDMLVKLYGVSPDIDLIHSLGQSGIKLVRALAPDKMTILNFINTNCHKHWPQESREGWMSECEAAMANNPPTCFLAVKDKSIVGFACYNATGKGFFGPTGILLEHRKKGIGKALLLSSLLAMREEGYGYAIIGWPAKDAIGFYEQTVHAELIPDSSPGIYGRLVNS